MLTKTIHFEENWNNKLSHPIFTKIVVCHPQTIDTYLNSIGNTFDIYWNRKKIGKAELLKVETPRHITDALLMLDSGLNIKEWKKRICKEDDVSKSMTMVMTFKNKFAQLGDKE